MGRFLRDLTLFLLLLVLILIPGFTVLVSAGEFVSVKSIGRLSESPQPLLVGKAYDDFTRELKMDETKRRHPKVLVLGSSRVGQFRSQFLKDPRIFYNASLAPNSFISYRYFIEELGSSTPDVVIADMLQIYFDPGNAKTPVILPNPFKSHSDVLDSVIGPFFRDGGWWKVYTDYAQGKFTLGDVYGSRDPRIAVVGLRALTADDGTTNDGSDHYGKIVTSREEQEKVRNQIAAMAAGVTDKGGGFDYGTGISSEAIEVLKQFLQSCKDRHIFVIGLLPPMPHAVYKAMQAHPNASYAEAFRTLSATLNDIYVSYGFDFYNFEDPITFGGSDKEMVERKHGSEKMYLRLFIKMAENSLPLSPFVDVPSLKATLKRTKGHYQVFPLQPF